MLNNLKHITKIKLSFSVFFIRELFLYIMGNNVNSKVHTNKNKCDIVKVRDEEYDKKQMLYRIYRYSTSIVNILEEALHQ